MQRTKMMPLSAWIGCLTIAAYAFAQATVMIMSRSFDAALLRDASAPQTRSENTVSLPNAKASGRNKSLSATGNDIGCDVKVEQVSDTEWTVDRASMRASTRDLNRFLMQARAVPVTKRGKTVGFRIIRISPGSLYEKIGLRNGDVLLRVNRQNLNDPAKIFSLYREMRNRRHISLLLSRDGQKHTFDYYIR